LTGFVRERGARIAAAFAGPVLSVERFVIAFLLEI